jgi:transposase
LQTAIIGKERNRMQIQTLLNRVHPIKGFVYGQAQLVEGWENPKILEVWIRPRKNNRPICSGCGRRGPVHQTGKDRPFEFVPVWGIAVFLWYRMRRVDCRHCGVKTERVPWAEGKQRVTTAYAWFLAGWAKRLSWTAVAEAFHTSYYHVFTAVRMAVEWGRARMDLSGIGALGIDEMQIGKGHKYVTAVYQIDEGRKRLLWLGERRTAKTLLKFFRWFGKERSAQLKFICSDMWRGYLKVVCKKATGAVHILDRFHIMANLGKALDKTRAQEVKRLKTQGLEAVLKGSRWCFLKRPENLTGRQAEKLADLLRHNLAIVRAYLLKEQFQFFWEYKSPAWAGKFLDQWCSHAMRSRIKPIKDFARSMRRHRPLLLNWFRAKKRFSSGVVEGLNNKAKTTMKNAYGFRTFTALQVALYHRLGDLPEPKFTHRFF